MLKRINPKISIIMGAYNCEKTLKECIDSILNQTYNNWEFIICDDNSTDNTFKILKEYENLYPDKFKILKNDINKGLAYSLNQCLKYTSGDYIARQDSDDLSLKNRLERQIEFLLNNEIYDLVGTQMISFDENQSYGKRGVSDGCVSYKVLKSGAAFCHATIMCKKEVYETLNGYRVNKYTLRCEDIDLWFRFFNNKFKGYNMNEALYMVRDDINAYKRRTIKSYIYLMKVNFEGYKLVNMPFIYYPYLFKPIVSSIIPRFIMKKYHHYKCKNI